MEEPEVLAHPLAAPVGPVAPQRLLAGAEGQGQADAGQLVGPLGRVLAQRGGVVDVVPGVLAGGHGEAEQLTGDPGGHVIGRALQHPLGEHVLEDGSLGQPLAQQRFEGLVPGLLCRPAILVLLALAGPLLLLDVGQGAALAGLGVAVGASADQLYRPELSTAAA